MRCWPAHRRLRQRHCLSCVGTISFSSLETCRINRYGKDTRCRWSYWWKKHSCCMHYRCLANHCSPWSCSVLPFFVFVALFKVSVIWKFCETRCDRSSIWILTTKCFNVYLGSGGRNKADICIKWNSLVSNGFRLVIVIGRVALDLSSLSYSVLPGRLLNGYGNKVVYKLTKTTKILKEQKIDYWRSCCAIFNLLPLSCLTSQKDLNLIVYSRAELPSRLSTMIHYNCSIFGSYIDVWVINAYKTDMQIIK